MSGSKPPLPRGRDQFTFSELVPFRSGKIRLWRSPLVWLVAFTVIVTVILFSYNDKIARTNDAQEKLDYFIVIAKITMFYFFALSLIAVHAYSKTDKPIYYYVLPALFIIWFMGYSGIWHYWYQPFDALSGGDKAGDSPELVTRIWHGFAGPGLREELLKAIPTLFGAALMVWAARFAVLPAPLTRLLRVRSPLDGMLMAFACGAAFIFFETGGQYITGAFIRYYRATSNADGAVGRGLTLLIPRTMRGWIGHMGYSGIFGYFIGLAVIRRSIAPQLLLGGLAVAALLHGLWDADLPGGDIPRYAVGGTVGLMVMGCFLKARQLDASLFGRGAETFGSIIVPAAYTPAPAPPAPAPPAPGSYAPAAIPPQAATPVIAPVQRPAALALALPTRTLPLLVGQAFAIDEPGLNPAQPVEAQVTQHPTNPAIIGLKNIGQGTWYARLRDGTVQSIETQRSLRLADGVSIDFGSGLIGKVVTA